MSEQDQSLPSKPFLCFKKPIECKVRFAGSGGEIVQTLEGPVKAEPGTPILTGVKGEEWPIPAGNLYLNYDYNSLEGVCTKKYVEVTAQQLTEPAQVKVAWCDDVLKGNPGDYLVTYKPGDVGIVQREIFEETYERLPIFVEVMDIMVFNPKAVVKIDLGT